MVEKSLTLSKLDVIENFTQLEVLWYEIGYQTQA
jgi:hypothetical protein